MPGSVTVLCGPRLGALVGAVADALHTSWGVVRQTGPGLRSGESPGLQYTKLVLRVLTKVALGRDAVVWLPEAGPELAVHQRRSLERVLQGLRPVVLVEAGGGVYPSWVRAAGGALPVKPFLDQAELNASLQLALQLARASGLSSKNSEAGFLEEALTAVRPSNPGAGTGSWRPGGVILVGDRPNARTWRPGRDLDRQVSWPFVSQLPEGCSAWLSEQLEALGVPETMLYWVNAFRADGSPTGDLRTLQAKLEPQLTVALGKQAAEALTRDGCYGWEQVHHPQHWKRFHHNERYRLLQLLARVVKRAA